MLVRAHCKAVKFNLQNRVRQLSLGKDQALRPVYEAVANGFDAVNESSRESGTVTVRIQRSARADQQTSFDGSPTGEITGFEIEDNGVGFTDDNYESFDEAYSAKKAETKGMGAGRFLFLKSFERAEIESTYRAAKRLMVRKFQFALPKGLGRSTKSEATTGQTGTIVKLIGLKREYKCSNWAETIARHLIEHTLEELLFSPRISFYLVDSSGPRINLRDIFRKDYQADNKVAQLTVGEYRFKLRHFLVRSAATIAAHKVNFCARNRCVTHDNLARYIPDLKDPLQIEGHDAYYLGTVSGDYLDECVNEGRTAFLMPDDPTFTNEPTKTQIAESVANRVKDYLKDHLAELNQRKNAHVRSVIGRTAPELRTVVDRHPEITDHISVDASDREILTTVSGQRYADRDEYTKLQAEILSKAKAGEKVATKEKALLERFADQSHEQAKIALCQFVLHRNVVLDVLRELLGTDEAGNPQKEEAVHQIIFPLRKTSDEIPPDIANLWVIDERLAFHHYLASDKRLDSLEPMQIDSAKEPDLIVFHHAFATTENSNDPSAITIIEFKRPSRDKYSIDENPYRQLKRYIADIREGNARDRSGIVLPTHPRFFAYIVADLQPNLEQILDSEGFQKGSDQEIMFKHEPNVPLYVEAMSYRRLVNDAFRRNRAFFTKLGIQ